MMLERARRDSDERESKNEAMFELEQAQLHIFIYVRNTQRTSFKMLFAWWWNCDTNTPTDVDELIVNE
jgi:hypothetical protein